MTYDGVYRYSYDAWNRLVKITKAFNNPDAGYALTSGSVVGQFEFDGVGRRIVKTVDNSADLDGEYVYHHQGQRIVEVRDGSGLVQKQVVYGTQYIDEPVQICINHDPENGDPATEPENVENLCDRFFYVLADPNYNVLGVVSRLGELAERYEYTPYGPPEQRSVFSHGWFHEDTDDDGDVDSTDVGNVTGYQDTEEPPVNRSDLDADGIVDVGDLGLVAASLTLSVPKATTAADDYLVMHPLLISFRDRDSTTGAATIALNDFGHQGLMHDEEFGLVYNRARMLHPTQGRFMQRDPLGYVDGGSLYECEASNPVGWLDPYGLACDLKSEFQQLVAKAIERQIAKAIAKFGAKAVLKKAAGAAAVAALADGPIPVGDVVAVGSLIWGAYNAWQAKGLVADFSGFLNWLEDQMGGKLDELQEKFINCLDREPKCCDIAKKMIKEFGDEVLGTKMAAGKKNFGNKGQATRRIAGIFKKHMDDLVKCCFSCTPPGAAGKSGNQWRKGKHDGKDGWVDDKGRFWQKGPKHGKDRSRPNDDDLNFEWDVIDPKTDKKLFDADPFTGDPIDKQKGK